MTTAATKLALVPTLLLSIAAVAAGTAAASTPAAHAPNPRISFTRPSAHVDARPFPRIRFQPLPRISGGRKQSA